MCRVQAVCCSALLRICNTPVWLRRLLATKQLDGVVLQLKAAPATSKQSSIYVCFRHVSQKLLWLIYLPYLLLAEIAAPIQAATKAALDHQLPATIPIQNELFLARTRKAGMSIPTVAIMETLHHPDGNTLGSLIQHCQNMCNMCKHVFLIFAKELRKEKVRTGDDQDAAKRETGFEC